MCLGSTRQVELPRYNSICGYPHPGYNRDSMKTLKSKMEMTSEASNPDVTKWRKDFARYV
jgi:hypothetical protein